MEEAYGATEFDDGHSIGIVIPIFLPSNHYQVRGSSIDRGQIPQPTMGYYETRTTKFPYLAFKDAKLFAASLAFPALLYLLPQQGYDSEVLCFSFLFFLRRRGQAPTGLFSHVHTETLSVPRSSSTLLR